MAILGSQIYNKSLITIINTYEIMNLSEVKFQRL